MSLQDQIYAPLPYILVGAASALGGSSVIFIAETWHRPLPVTIHDTEVLHQMKAIPKDQLKENNFHSKRKEKKARDENQNSQSVEEKQNGSVKVAYESSI